MLNSIADVLVKLDAHQVMLAQRYRCVQGAVLEAAAMAQPRVATDLGAEEVGHAGSLSRQKHSATRFKIARLW